MPSMFLLFIFYEIKNKPPKMDLPKEIEKSHIDTAFWKHSQQTFVNVGTLTPDICFKVK